MEREAAEKWQEIKKIYVKHSVAGVSLHVVGGLVEVTDTWDVILSRLANNIASGWNDHGCVPNGVSVHRISFQDRW